MSKTTKVSKVMTGQVIVAEVNNSIQQIQDLFIEYDMHHIPVVNEGRVIGIISQTDLLKCYDKLMKSGDSVSADNVNSKYSVESVMTKKPISVAPVTSLATASDMMVEHHCHSLPVVEHGQIVGILTARDVVRFVAETED
ncbi:MAG: CBS domain-containing protein [Bacteroidetes bacterium]|nr:CBS domain-containing protein [Bacteroidota bacterium]MDA1118979.1 CBS domain-containing protein [Bacteroidota bacterium]